MPAKKPTSQPKTDRLICQRCGATGVDLVRVAPGRYECARGCPKPPRPRP